MNRAGRGAKFVRRFTGSGLFTGNSERDLIESNS